MTRRGLLVTAIAAVANLTAFGQAGTGGPQSTFRSTTDVVTVDVAVRSGNTPVPGLTAADFVLLDNGVKQQIESLDAARVPLDVSLVIDVSGGAPQWWGTPRTPDEIGKQLTEIVRKTSSILGPSDRLRLHTIDTYTNEVIALQPADKLPAVTGHIATNGLSSLHDALIAAMLQPVEPARRHLIVVKTKMEDTISGPDAAALQDVARRSEAVMHIVEGESLVGDTKCLFGCEFPRKRFWRPVQRRDELVLPEIAQSTGGAFYSFNALGLYRDFADQFKDVFDDFRRGYVLRYTPQGVKREGWHEIKVSVPGWPSHVVTARRGYAIEAAATPSERPAPPRSTAGRGAAAPTTFESIVEAYARRDYATVLTGFRQTRDLERFIRDFRGGSSPWPSAPRLDAVFALELALAGLASQDADAREEANKLLIQYHTLIRQPLGADTFECMWYWTETAALEGLIRPAVALPFVTRALERCDEPRLHLAHALVTDQRWPLGTTTPTPGARVMFTPTRDQVRDVPRLYEEAMKYPDTAAEARVRGAWFFYRTGRVDRALELLDRAHETPADRPVQYLAGLFRGHALRALGRQDDAAAAYRAALTNWPGGQSARVALMTLLLGRDDREAAGSIAVDVQTAPEEQFDPWWQYWQGDFRAFAVILDRLRELAR